MGSRAKLEARRDGRNKVGALLWTLQALLAGLFLFAGVAKLTMPPQVLAAQTGLPAAFMEFISVAEVLGAIGLVLPGLFRIRTQLTAWAAAGLVVIMIGATSLTIGKYGVAASVMPLVVGILSAYVALGRWRWVPLRGRSTGLVLHAAS